MPEKLASESHIGQYTFINPTRVPFKFRLPCFCCRCPITLSHVQAVELTSGVYYHFHVCCWNSNPEKSRDEWDREHGIEYRDIEGDIYRVRRRL